MSSTSPMLRIGLIVSAFALAGCEERTYEVTPEAVKTAADLCAPHGGYIELRNNRVLSVLEALSTKVSRDIKVYAQCANGVNVSKIILNHS